MNNTTAKPKRKKHFCQYQQMQSPHADGGYDNLVFAIIEQAVLDMRLLRKAGVVVGNKALDPYPTERLNYRQIDQDYRTPYAVKELISFFESGWAGKLLVSVGAKVDAAAMVAHIGLKNAG